MCTLGVWKWWVLQYYIVSSSCVYREGLVGKKLHSRHHDFCTIFIWFLYNFCIIFVPSLCNFCMISVQFLYDFHMIFVQSSYDLYNLCTIFVQYLYDFCTIFVPSLYDLYTIFVRYLYDFFVRFLLMTQVQVFPLIGFYIRSSKRRRNISPLFPLLFFRVITRMHEA